MISSSANFRAFLDLPGRTPIYCVALTDGVLAADGSITGATVTDRICTSLPQSGDFAAADQTLIPIEIRRLADPSEGRLELSHFQFQWLDEGGDGDERAGRRH